MIYYDEKERIGKEIVLVKRFKRIREISAYKAFKLHVISKFLEKPVLIKVKENFEGIHYRYGIPTVSEKEIKKIEKRESYFVYKGGRFYKIDAEKLLRRLNELGISISEFCRKVGISKRNFYNYLEGQMVSEETYEKIERIVGDVREKDIRKILEARKFNFEIKMDEKKEKIYRILKEKFETYVIGNEFIDFCLKCNKRIVLKIGDVCEEKLEIVAKELESEPIVLKDEKEIKRIVMNY